MFKKSILFIIALTVLTHTTHAGTKGTSGVQSLKVIASPKLSAMGEAFCAVDGDVNCIASNPAGLSFMQKSEVSLVQNNWIDDITNQYLAFGMPAKLGTLGLSANILSIKDIIGRDESGSLTSNYNANETIIGLSYASQISTKLGIGLNAKMISGKIDAESASGYGADVGALYKASEQINIGLVVQSVGTEIKYISEGDPLPMNIKLGAAYNAMDNLLLALDLNSPNDNDIKGGTGIEYILQAGESLQIPIRAGYRTGLDTEGLSGLGAGAGVMWNNKFGIDLSWNPMGDVFGDSLKLGIHLKM